MGFFNYVKRSLNIWFMNQIGTIIVLSVLVVIAFIYFKIKLSGGLF